MEVNGFLNFHGVSQKVKSMIFLKKQGERIHATGNFIILLDDYNIKIPKVLQAKLSNEIQVKLDLNFEAQKDVSIRS